MADHPGVGGQLGNYLIDSVIGRGGICRAGGSSGLAEESARRRATA